MKVKIDEAGLVMIPQRVMVELGWKYDSVVDLDVSVHGTVVLSKVDDVKRYQTGPKTAFRDGSGG